MHVDVVVNRNREVMNIIHFLAVPYYSQTTEALDPVLQHC
jgi:hypothetical protein